MSGKCKRITVVVRGGLAEIFTNFQPGEEIKIDLIDWDVYDNSLDGRELTEDCSFELSEEDFEKLYKD